MAIIIAIINNLQNKRERYERNNLPKLQKSI